MAISMLLFVFVCVHLKAVRRENAKEGHHKHSGERHSDAIGQRNAGVMLRSMQFDQRCIDLNES